MLHPKSKLIDDCKPDMRAMMCLALEDERNEAKATIHWRFTIVDARQKLARLYPKLDTADQKTL